MDSKEKFIIGCNYWASNAGTYMWRNWDEAVVEDDLKKLADCGIECLRVFPLWSDFQPISCYLNGSARKEMRINDQPLDKSPEGIAGVDPVMIQRFARFTELCDKYHIKLLVCLLNGWMSGRMFFPPAFTNCNPMTNKTFVKWQIRFVKYFVNRFKDCQTIVAWEPGNETNVMLYLEQANIQKDEYYVWMSTLVNTIKSCDPTRPVIAGIHGLTMDGDAPVADIGEICDVVTVHPYPAFVPHCFVDDLNTMKSRLHATAESVYYSDIGGKLCLCEEIGTLCAMLGGEAVAAEYIKASANSLWASGSTGILWWCSHDQGNFLFPPYDWCGVERELGLIKDDGSYKKVAGSLKDMRAFRDSHPRLPDRKRDAVCILTHGQDHWAVAYSSFVLAKQAGFELQFADADYEIPVSNLYMLPSVAGEIPLPLRTQRELLRRVREDGATLYISWNGALLSGFQDMMGAEVIANRERQCTQAVTVHAIQETLHLQGSRKLVVRPVTAQVLATEENGDPALLCNHYGKGKIYFLGLDLEQTLCSQTGAFEKPYYKLYEYLFKADVDSVVTQKGSPLLGITEHPLPEGGWAVTVINYGTEALEETLTLKTGCSFCDVSAGTAESDAPGTVKVSLSAGEMCIFTVK